MDHYQCGNRIETLKKEVERLRLELVRIKADTGDWDAQQEIKKLRAALDAERQRPNAPSAWAQMKLERDQARAEIEKLRAANVRLQEALVADPVDQMVEIEKLRAERDDARERHDDHCAMGCEPPWSKRALRGEGE